MGNLHIAGAASVATRCGEGHSVEQVLALTRCLVVQVLNDLLLVDGEQRVAGGAVASDLDGLGRQRDRWVVAKAKRALNCVNAAATDCGILVVMYGFARRTLIELIDVRLAAFPRAVFVVVDFVAGPALVERPDLNLHEASGQAPPSPGWRDSLKWGIGDSPGMEPDAETLYGEEAKTNKG
ncbi:hypothetical protein KSS93_15185 [Pseudomonas xanthosomatis]|uniref:hypothetical protein n=1 Tax=Pseudomonas xanthosomatis TaxID=2842356 RepID=UPI001C3D816B|nr:hypothetical protein [Pseudomonas xanthosomatis]QXH44240.1 hypothetical protein KSS93_15185 [Pseudomonas xanthosomatis]